MRRVDQQDRARVRAWRIDWALGALMIAAFSGPGMMLLGATNDPTAPPTPQLRLYWPPVYLLGLVLLARRWRIIRHAWAPALVVAAPVAWAVLSKSWSIAPDDTGRRALALGLTTLCGLVLGGGFAPRELPRMTATALTALGLASAAVALLLPRYGVETQVNVGCWRGLWLTKNALAAFMAVATLSGLCAAESAKRGWPWLLAALFCAFVLVMSRGKTALVCLALAMVFPAVRRLGRGGSTRKVLAAWIVGTAAMAVGFIAAFVPGLMFHAIGKDPTLTGRTEIWNAVWNQAMSRPLTGFGFAAFWTQTSIPAKIVDQQTGWNVPEAHNAWLDLLVGTGWIGAGLAAVCCLLALAPAFLRMRRWGDGLFAPAYVAMTLAMSLTESVILDGNNMIWVVFIAVLASVASLRPRRPPSGDRSTQMATTRTNLLAHPVSAITAS